MIVSIIAAINGPMMTIGKDGKVPWTCPEDMRRFKELTTGFPVIMGRVTFESIGFPDGLPGRANIVVSGHDTFSHGSGVTVVNSVSAAIDKCRGMDVNECFVIGGASVYREALSLGEVDRIYLTVIPGDYEGDTFFPAIDFNDWSKMSKDETSEAVYMILGRKSVSEKLGRRNEQMTVRVSPDGTAATLDGDKSADDADGVSVEDLENEMNGITTADVCIVDDEYADDISVLADIVNGDATPDGIDPDDSESAEENDIEISSDKDDITDMAQVLLHIIDDVSYLVNQAELEGSEARAVQNSIMLISTVLAKHGTAINADRSDIACLMSSTKSLSSDMDEFGQNAVLISDAVIKLKKTVGRLACGLAASGLLAVSCLVLLILLR